MILLFIPIAPMTHLALTLKMVKQNKKYGNNPFGHLSRSGPYGQTRSSGAVSISISFVFFLMMSCSSSDINKDSKNPSIEKKKIIDDGFLSVDPELHKDSVITNPKGIETANVKIYYFKNLTKDTILVHAGEMDKVLRFGISTYFYGDSIGGNDIVDYWDISFDTIAPYKTKGLLLYKPPTSTGVEFTFQYKLLSENGKYRFFQGLLNW